MHHIGAVLFPWRHNLESNSFTKVVDTWNTSISRIQEMCDQNKTRYSWHTSPINYFKALKKYIIQVQFSKDMISNRLLSLRWLSRDTSIWRIQEMWAEQNLILLVPFPHYFFQSFRNGKMYHRGAIYWRIHVSFIKTLRQPKREATKITSSPHSGTGPRLISRPERIRSDLLHLASDTQLGYRATRLTTAIYVHHRRAHSRRLHPPCALPNSSQFSPNYLHVQFVHAYCCVHVFQLLSERTDEGTLGKSYTQIQVYVAACTHVRHASTTNEFETRLITAPTASKLEWRLK